MTNFTKCIPSESRSTWTYLNTFYFISDWRAWVQYRRVWSRCDENIRQWLLSLMGVQWSGEWRRIGEHRWQHDHDRVYIRWGNNWRGMATSVEHLPSQRYVKLSSLFSQCQRGFQDDPIPGSLYFHSSLKNNSWIFFFGSLQEKQLKLNKQNHGIFFTVNSSVLRQGSISFLVPITPCESRTPPTDGSVKCSDEQNIGSSCIYQCNEGFGLVGYPVSTCSETGSWDSDAPVCKGKFTWFLLPDEQLVNNLIP